MPYIDPSLRDALAEGQAPQTAGELNYLITRMVDEYLQQKGGVRYSNLNEVVGVLECVKLELYRRIAAPYEDSKCVSAGDVYHSVAQDD